MYKKNSWGDCDEFVTVKFPSVFKLCRYRVNAGSNLSTVTFGTVSKMCRHRVNAVQVSDVIFLQVTRILYGDRELSSLSKLTIE